MRFRMDYGFWSRGPEHRSLNGDFAEKDMHERWTTEFRGMVISHRESKEEGSPESNLLLMAVQDMKWRRWKIWLESEMYGAIVQARLEELEGGSIGAKNLEMGRSQRRALERTMRHYVMIKGTKPKLFFREKNGELATCILEDEVKLVLNQLHEGHGHFAARITLGRACGKVYWPSRALDIGRWGASCEHCQTVSRIQKAGELR